MAIGWYEIFKFLHIAATILWIGSAVGLMILSIRADKANDNADFGRLIGYNIYLAPRVFIPASALVLILGIIMAFMVWGFTEPWIIIGLIGLAATFATGFFLLKPRADKLVALIAKEGYNDDVVRQGREFLTISKFDYLMLFVVVADMVFKPALSDWPLLLVMIAVLVAGAYCFLRQVLMPAKQR